MEVMFSPNVDTVKWCKSIAMEGVEPLSANWESICVKQSKIFPLGSTLLVTETSIWNLYCKGNIP